MESRAKTRLQSRVVLAQNRVDSVAMQSEEGLGTLQMDSKGEYSCCFISEANRNLSQNSKLNRCVLISSFILC